MSIHHILGNPDSTAPYKIAILIRLSAMIKKDVFEHYIHPLIAQGISADDIIVYSLDYKDSGKAPVSYIRAYLSHLFKALNGNQIQTLFIADPNYFNVLTGSKTADANYGYILPCIIPKQEHFKCILTLNYKAL